MSLFPSDLEQSVQAAFLDDSVIDATDSRLGVLHRQKQRTQLSNSALLITCCLKTNDCVHRQIQEAISSHNDTSITLPSVRVIAGEQDPYAAFDFQGNNLLFFAARCGAPLSILLGIIENTPDINTLNDDGSNFLFALDPQGLRYSDLGECTSHSDFLRLITVLELRGFNFDHLDHDGRSFLAFLCLRSSFSMSWIAILFHRDQMWHRRINELAQKRDSSSAYIYGYLAGHPDLPSLPQDTLAVLSKPVNIDYGDPRGKTKLHDRLLEHLQVHTLYDSKIASHQPPDLDLYASDCNENDINTYDKGGYTPLTLFLNEALSRRFPTSDFFIISQVQTLLSLGANINARCRNGDTILHMAARNCRFKIMEFFINSTSSKLHINHQNNEGDRAVDCLVSALERATESKGKEVFFTPVEGMECLLLLSDHGSKPCCMLS